MIKTLKLKYSTENILKISFLGIISILVVYIIYVQNSFNIDISEKQNNIQKITEELQKTKKSLEIITKSKNDLTSEIQEIKKKSLIQFTKADIMKDIIIHYNGISNRVKKVIIETILEESIKYDINPLILYSLIHTESSMRYWIEHKPTFVVIDKKKIKIKAVGLGGVVYEWWGEKLKKAKILSVRSDLFDPAINIRATAFVYNELFKMKKHPKATTQDESAMIRYFGGGYKSYFKKIDDKIASLIGNKMYRVKVKPNTNKPKNINILKKVKD